MLGGYRAGLNRTYQHESWHGGGAPPPWTALHLSPQAPCGLRQVWHEDHQPEDHGCPHPGVHPQTQMLAPEGQQVVVAGKAVVVPP